MEADQGREIKELLKSLQLEKYVERFLKEEIFTLEAISAFSEKELQDIIGIDVKGARTSIIRSVERITQGKRSTAGAAGRIRRYRRQIVSLNLQKFGMDVQLSTSSTMTIANGFKTFVRTSRPEVKVDIGSGVAAESVTLKICRKGGDVVFEDSRKLYSSGDGRKETIFQLKLDKSSMKDNAVSFADLDPFVFQCHFAGSNSIPVMKSEEVYVLEHISQIHLLNKLAMAAAITPELTSVEPKEGKSFGRVFLLGKNFPPKPKVFFGSFEALVADSSDKWIACDVPPAVGVATVNVCVHHDTLRSNVIPFKYLPSAPSSQPEVWNVDKLVTMNLTEAQLNGRDALGNTALQYAAAQGRADLVGQLIDRGANVNIANRMGITPLIRAVQNGHKDVVDRLLASSSLDVNAADLDGRTALHASAVGNHLPWLQELLTRGALPWKRTTSLETAFSLAVREGHTDIVQWMLSQNYRDISFENREGQSLVHVAVLNQREAVLRLLLENEFDTDLPNWEGHTPLDVAVAENLNFAVDLLNKSGARRREMLSEDRQNSQRSMSSRKSDSNQSSHSDSSSEHEEDFSFLEYFKLKAKKISDSPKNKKSKKSKKNDKKKEESPLSELDKKWAREQAAACQTEEETREFVAHLKENHKVINSIYYLVEAEMTANTLGVLREESVGTNLLKAYWFHFEGIEFLKEYIRPLVRAVKSSTRLRPLEVDIHRVDAMTAQKNLTKLLEILKAWITTVFFESHDAFPLNFLKILHRIYHWLNQSDPQKALQLFGGFLLLRFICPAIVSPQKYGVIKDISFNTQRSLVIMGKYIQTTANQIELEKNDGLKGGAEFVSEMMPQMLEFIRNLMDETKERIPLEEKKQREKPKKAAEALLKAGFL